MFIRLREEIERRRAELSEKCCGLRVVNVLDRSGNILSTTEERTAILGYEMDEIQGVSIFTYCHPEDELNLLVWLAQMIDTNTCVCCEFRLLHKNGQSVSVRAYGVVLKENGEVSGFVAAYHERLELERWEEKYRLLQSMKRSKQKRTG